MTQNSGNLKPKLLICHGVASMLKLTSSAPWLSKPSPFAQHHKQPLNSQNMSCVEREHAGISSSRAPATDQNAPCPTLATTVLLPHMEHKGAKNLSALSPNSLPDPISNQRPPPIPTPSSSYKVPTPIRPNVLDQYLTDYDQTKRKTLVHGFTSGFSLGAGINFPSNTFRNHPSVSQHEQFVELKISKEIQQRRVKGPYTAPPLPNFVCSPLGVVPKKIPGTYRIIHDLSFPRNGNSINSTIPQLHSTVSLESFDDVANLVLAAGRHAHIAKADIEEAFKIIPMSPLDYHKLGFTFRNKFYFNTVLPMGASSSVSIFESFAKALQWILQHKLGVSSVSHIIDDFIFVGPAHSETCHKSLDIFFKLAEDIGVPIKHDKTVLPSTSVEVHGITINTNTLSAHLPQDKILNLKSLLSTIMNRKKITLQQLQSILGHLNFASKVIKPGRCFLRRLYDLTKGITQPQHFIKLTKEVRADLKLWHSFLDNYNCCTLLTGDRFISSHTIKLHSDASGSIGFGCTFKSSWTFGLFPDCAKRHHINILELYPIALAVSLFANALRNKNILFICDNQAVVYCLNKQTSKDPVMMHLIRIIVLKSLQYNFCFRSKHIVTTKNIVCDRLSRFQVQEALEAAPYLDKDPCPIPRNLSPIALLK